MASVAMIARPQRWDAPFGPEMADADVERLLALPEFASIDGDAFPKHTPLDGILRNDTRIVRYRPGDIVVREGDYGNSAFLVVNGNLRVVISPALPRNLIGRQHSKRKNFIQALGQLWTNRTCRKYATHRATAASRFVKAARKPRRMPGFSCKMFRPY